MVPCQLQPPRFTATGLAHHLTSPGKTMQLMHEMIALGFAGRLVVRASEGSPLFVGEDGGDWYSLLS